MAGMDFQLTVTIPTGGFFRRFSLLFNREVKRAEKDIKNRLLYSAREVHRYKHKTMTLRDATKVKGNLLVGGISLYVDTREADYGRYIITGQRSWASDPFLDEALNKNIKWINDRIQKAVDSAVIQFNRLK